jgi:hypothetical protein
MKLTRANCANAGLDRQLTEIDMKEPKRARPVARAKGASGIARKIKSQIKAGPGLASSCPGRENIAAHKSPHVHLWKRLTGSPA